MDSKELWGDFLKLLKREDWAGAIKIIDRLIEHEPENSNYYLKKGDVCQKNGDRAWAVDAYLRAARLLDRDGFEKKALAVYKMVLRLDSVNREAVEYSNRQTEGIPSAAALVQPFSREDPEQQNETIHENDPVSASQETRLEAETAESYSFPENVPAESAMPDRPLPGILSPFTEAETEEILGRAEIRSFSNGEYVVEEGDSGDSVYIIRKGCADVIAHILQKEIRLKTLSEGDLFGEVAFLTGRPRTANVIAEGDLDVYEINRVLLEEIIERRPEVMAQINEIYRARVKDTITKVKSK